MPLLEHFPVRYAQIFSGTANPELAQSVVEELDTNLSECSINLFSDGEIYCELEESVRGNYVFVIQSHGGGGMDVDKAIAEQKQLCAAAAASSAAKVIAVCPYLGYSRRDRRTSREAIVAKRNLRDLENNGANQIVCIDLHSGQSTGFADNRVDNLTAGKILRNAIIPELTEGVVVVSPDPGRTKAASGFRRRLPTDLNAGIAYIDKIRPPGSKNQVEALEVIGDVDGRQCLINDDMIDTAGTLKEAVNALRERGATDVMVTATHGILSGNAIENINASAISRLVITDTRAFTPEQLAINNLKVASVAKLIADAIHEIFTDGSISSLFEQNEHIQ